MLPCKNCGYQQNIPGDCHIKCTFDWGLSGKDRPRNNHAPHTMQWFRFPFNYDPLWGPDECAARADKADPTMVVQYSPLVELLSMLR